MDSISPFAAPEESIELHTFNITGCPRPNLLLIYTQALAPLRSTL